MINFTLDGQPLSVEAGTSILEAARQHGVKIPYFCYHPKLSIAANCRMCLVEVEATRKPQPSCMTHVQEGMVIHSKSPMVKKAQEGAMEFLLLNHPLDCPVCDQGGECDLQNMAYSYGCGSSRSNAPKRGVPPKDMGPLIGTHMTRCIHCTRCIRFSKEIAGVPELDIQGRGEHAEVLSYMNEMVESELSGNVIDICPVGALTNKPYAMRWRPWELTSVPSIDVMDSTGSHINIDTRDNRIMRITPRVCDSLNQEWLADHSRFYIDGLDHQRITTPCIRNSHNLLEPSEWHHTVDRVASLIKDTDPSDIAVLVGDLVDLETVTLLRNLLDQKNIVNRDSRLHSMPNRHSIHYTAPSFEEIEQADTVILVNTSIRDVAPLINIRLRGKNVAYVYENELNLTYPATYLGADLSSLCNEAHDFAKTLKNSKKPLVLVDPSVYGNSQLVLQINQIMNDYQPLQANPNTFGCIQHTCNQVGNLYADFTPGANGLDTKGILENIKRWKLLLLIGFDAPVLEQSKPHGQVVYIGHHYDVGAEHAHILLPTRAYAEDEATYVNTIGLAQQTQKAATGPDMARPAWRIIQALHQKLGDEAPITSRHDINLPAKERENMWVPIPTDTPNWSIYPRPLHNVIMRNSPTWVKTLRNETPHGGCHAK